MRSHLPLIISFDCCCCASKSFCSEVPLFVLPFGLPGPRFSFVSGFFVPKEVSSKVLFWELFRLVAGCIGFKLLVFDSTMLVLLFGCEVGCEVLIWGLTWAVFGAILLSDFFLFRSVINEIKVMIAIIYYNVLIFQLRKSIT